MVELLLELSLLFQGVGDFQKLFDGHLLAEAGMDGQIDVPHTAGGDQLLDLVASLQGDTRYQHIARVRIPQAIYIFETFLTGRTNSMNVGAGAPKEKYV